MTEHPLPGLRTHDICGVPVAAITLREVVELAEDVISRRGQLRLGVVNAAKLVKMRHDENLRRDVLSSHIVVADGMSVVWAGRMLGIPLPERVAGIDLMHAILASGNRHRYRVYCLGSTREVLQRTVECFRRDYPNVQIVGARDGYFSAAEEPALAAAISAARPDVLFVAMSSPHKEAFLARWGGQLRIPLCHGVGGSFDVVAGVVQRAPVLWQRAGLEWLYRVKQEPRRLWRRYLVTNCLFIHMVGVEIVRRTWNGRIAGDRSFSQRDPEQKS